MSSISLPLSISPNSTISLLDQCRTMPELRQIHACMIKSNIVSHTVAVSRLISFCSVSGDHGGMEYAVSVLDRIREPDPFIFYEIIRGFSRTEAPYESVVLYSRILRWLDSLQNLEFSLPCVLKACGKSSAFEEGRQIHAQVLKTHFQADQFVMNSILRMYLELGEVEIAKCLFDKMPVRDVISWNSMIAGCIKSGSAKLALKVFEEMPQKDLISWNSMIDGAMKSGMCDLASDLFDRMDEGDVVTWTSMITGLVLNSRPKEALELFRRMLSSGIRPDVAAIVNVLSAIADLGFSTEGLWIHGYICRSNIDLISGVLGSALIDMYCKCGLVDNAYHVFRSICHGRRIGDWNSMISGLSMHGLGLKALEVFHEMEVMDIKPNEITFLGVLNACNHSGLVEEGRFYFNLMQNKYKMEPNIKHYGCLIDLLGRAGLLLKAQKIIKELPMEPDAMAWKSVLSACVKHGHLILGEHAAMRAIDLAPHDSSCYVLLSNIYAKFGRYEDVEGIRRLMRERGVRKVPGCSALMVNGWIHEFLVGKKMGSECRMEVVSKLDEVICSLKLQGYEPDLTQALVDVEEEEKEGLVNVHSEKMAIAFGLINLSEGAPIHIVKNLRVCGDCHSFSKLVSRVYNREIILRDQNRFHHFKGGSCSCNDYW